MVRKILFPLMLLAIALAVIVKLGLSDNDARPAIGERKIAISGEAEIHYFVAGPAAARPVVLLPSYARSVSDFNELIKILNEEGYRTVAIQPRGIDGSTLPSMDITFHTNAADVLAVLDMEKIQQSISIVGHAYGNRTARTFATDYPERSHQLILLAAGGEDPTPPDVSAAIMRALFGILPDSTRREAIAFAFFAEGNTVPEYWMSGWYPKAGLAQGRATAAASTPTTNANWGAGGDDQLVILQPSEDLAAAHGAASLLARFPERVTLYKVDGAGHAILPEQEERVGILVLAALQR